MNKFKILFKNLYGASLILLGFILIFSHSFIGGLLFLIGGIIMVPITLKKVEEKIGKPLNRSLKYISIISCIFIGAIFIGTKQADKDK